MGIDRGKAIRTWRLALTCIFLFLITWYLEVPESSWTLVTIWFVMYEYSTVGGVLNKSKARLLGTFLSVLYGSMIVYFGDNNPVLDILALIPGLFIYSYFFMGTDKTYVGTIGAVTLTIILLNYNDLNTAILRILNVVIGIVGSALMIRFFYPQYARQLLIQDQIFWLKGTIAIIHSYLNLDLPLERAQARTLAYEQSLLKTFPDYERSLNEALMETYKTPEFVSHCRAVKKHVQELSRMLIIFISYLSTEHLRSHPAIQASFFTMLNKLETLHRLLTQRPFLPLITLPPLAAQPEELQEMPQLEYERLAAEHLKKIDHQIDLLNDALKQIVLVYDSYQFDLVSTT